MPFTITSVFRISSIAPNSSNVKRVFYADLQPEEDSCITVMMIAYEGVVPDNIDVGDHVFATGKAAWIKLELQITVLTMSEPISDLNIPIPASAVATAIVKTLPRSVDNGYSFFEVSIDVYHERNTISFPAKITYRTDNPRFIKFANSLTTNSNIYIHGNLYIQDISNVPIWIDAKDVNYIGRTGSGNPSGQIRPWQLTPPNQSSSKKRPLRPWEAVEPLESPPPLPTTPPTIQIADVPPPARTPTRGNKKPKLPASPASPSPSIATSSAIISPIPVSDSSPSTSKRKSTASLPKQRVLPRRMSAKAAGKQKEQNQGKSQRITDFALEDNDNLKETEEGEDVEEEEEDD